MAVFQKLLKVLEKLMTTNQKQDDITSKRMDDSSPNVGTRLFFKKVIFPSQDSITNVEIGCDCRFMAEKNRGRGMESSSAGYSGKMKPCEGHRASGPNLPSAGIRLIHNRPGPFLLRECPARDVTSQEQDESGSGDCG